MVSIVVVGANGQVASEVVLLLRGEAGIALRPLVRTRGGSAFLRYCGVPVVHAAITDGAAAKAALAGADVIANFALAGGTPSETQADNDAIVRATFDHAPPGATVVFFSTLAVHGSYSQSGQRQRSAYGDFKLRNEKLVDELARLSGRKAYVLRLGHVAGELQNITALIRGDLLRPPVLLPDPERASNLTSTATIAEALLSIAQGRANAPGHYDLVNVPQWTWREVYAWEAGKLGTELVIETAPATAQASGARNLARSALGLGKRLASKDTLSRLAAYLPQDINDKLLAEHYLARARAEIDALAEPAAVRNAAALWPALPIRAMPGLRTTREVLEAFATADLTHAKARWPQDIAV